MDFTIAIYRQLLQAIQKAGFAILTFEDYLTKAVPQRYVILRHDVDEMAKNALVMATEEQRLGIRATYYFRTVKQSNQPHIIQQIADMGHEIGYHYEDLAKTAGNTSTAIKTFEQNLVYFRQFYQVKTVCMHGSSTSRYDNRDLWKYYRMADYGIIGEPYISLDFNQLYYLTDTGYAWDGGKFAVRDIVSNNMGITFHSTHQIIQALQNDTYPAQSMILAHTLWSPTVKQRCYLALREWIRNNVKLLSKRNKYIAYIYKKIVDTYWKQ